MSVILTLSQAAELGLGKTKIVAQFVYEGAANLVGELVGGAAVGENVSSVEDDLVGAGPAGWLAVEWYAAENAQEGTVVGQGEFALYHFVGQVLDHYGHLAEIAAKLRVDGIYSATHQVVELVVGCIHGFSGH